MRMNERMNGAERDERVERQILTSLIIKHNCQLSIVIMILRAAVVGAIAELADTQIIQMTQKTHSRGLVKRSQWRSSETECILRVWRVTFIYFLRVILWYSQVQCVSVNSFTILLCASCSQWAVIYCAFCLKWKACDWLWLSVYCYYWQHYADKRWVWHGLQWPACHIPINVLLVCGFTELGGGRDGRWEMSEHLTGGHTQLASQ